MPCPRILRTDLAITVALLLLLVAVRVNIDQCMQQVVPSLINPDFFPSVVLNCLIAINLLILILDLCRCRRTSLVVSPAGTAVAGAGDEAPDRVEGEGGGLTQLFIYIGMLFGYVLGLHWLAFVCATPPVMLLIALMLGLRGLYPVCRAHELSGASRHADHPPHRSAVQLGVTDELSGKGAA